MSNPKLNREQLTAILGLLRGAGVKEWAVIRTRRGHNRIEFYRRGKPCMIPFCGSGDWRAHKNTIAKVKRVLESRA